MINLLTVPGACPGRGTSTTIPCIPYEFWQSFAEETASNPILIVLFHKDRWKDKRKHKHCKGFFKGIEKDGKETGDCTKYAFDGVAKKCFFGKGLHADYVHYCILFLAVYMQTVYCIAHVPKSKIMWTWISLSDIAECHWCTRCAQRAQKQKGNTSFGQMLALTVPPMPCKVQLSTMLRRMFQEDAAPFQQGAATIARMQLVISLGPCTSHHIWSKL